MRVPDLPQCLHSKLSILRRALPALMLTLALFVPAPGVAATATFGIGIDTDNNPATGCALATANGAVAGVEIVARSVVTTSAAGATVTRLEQQRCNAGSLSASATYETGGWPVGFGNGTGASGVIEYSVPLSTLGATGAMRAVAFGNDGSGGQDATSPFTIAVAAEAASPVLPVPLSPWLVLPLSLLLAGAAAAWRRRHPDQTALLVLLVFVAGSGLVWAATVLRDGNVGDWAGVSPAVTDAKGDAPANADIVAVFTQQDGANLYFRIDADIRKDAAANQAPAVSAGTAQTVTLPAGATLNGSATDDGLPNPPGALTYAWSKVSGPGTVSFGNATSAATTAAFSVAGSYVLRLSASDTALTGTADLTVTVNPAGTANQAPVVNAGGDQAITLPAGANLAGSATDDGLPSPPGALTYAWSKVSGPGTVSFGNTANASTTASFGAAGTYVLRLTASDSALSASDELTINVSPVGTVNVPPVVSAGANQTISLPAPATLAGTATDDGLPNPPGQLTTTWSLVSGPLSGVFFANPALPATTATFSAPGTYVLRLTASDGASSQSSTVEITVNDGAPQLDTIANRTVEAGNRLQILLQASDGNANDALTYELVTAPAGATLNPAPLIDWVPTVAQAGQHTFTARVTDANGNATTTSFQVDVVHVNKPPQLGPQASLTMAVGPAFARTLTASDPDAGAVLTFALVAGPAGMTLSGADLNWSTAGRSPGDYAVTVKVSDPAGSFDQKTFTVTLMQAAPAPVAVDDTYEVRVGATLSVSAPGVLANDLNPGGSAIAARKLTDPTAGSLTAFAADGSFTFKAPASPPGVPLATTKTWNGNATWSYGAHEVVGDLNGDGYPDIISHNLNADIRARSGRDAAELWALDVTGATDCQVMTGGGMNHRVLADIDDSGRPAYVLTTKCAREGSNWHDHIIAFDHLGKVKWVSPPLSKPHPDIRRGATPVPPGGFTPGGLAWRRGLSAARLTANGAPVLLMRAEITNNDGYTYYVDAANQFHYAGCRAVTGLVADENRACRATLIISGTDGSVLQTLVAPNPTGTGLYGGPDAIKELPPIAFDIDGDGRVDLVSGAEVWKQNASGGFDLAWQLTTSVNDTAVADLDGDGKAEIVFIRNGSIEPATDRGIFVYDHDGRLLRRIPLPAYWMTPLTIADVDGDGRSDIVVGADGTLYAFRDDGRPIWAYKVPEEAPDNATLAPIYTQPAEGFRTSNAAPQVYDLDGDGIAEVVFAAHSRIMIVDGRTGLRKVDPYWTYSNTYADVSALMLIDMNNDGHVDIVQNGAFLFNCGFVGFPPGFCNTLVGPIVLSGGSGNAWLPGPKAWPHLQYRSTAIDARSRVLHDTTVSRVFRTPEQQGSVRDPRLAQAVSFTYEADDSVARSAPAKVIVNIVPDNKPPVFTSVPPKSLWQRFAPNPPGGLVTNYYDLAATDPDPGDTITFSLKSAPAWVTMSGPARIRFEPTCGSYGYPCPWGWTTVIVTATDSRGATTDQIFIVNLTTDATTVPDVVGQLLDAAKVSLLAADLQGVGSTEVHAPQAAGTVLAQDGPAGATVGRFDDVRLTVSKGPAPVSMPFVVGKPLATAQALLVGAGLSVAVTTTFSPTIPAGEIMAQSPAFGTELASATAPPVNLTVSAGGPLPAPIASIVLEPGPGPALRLAGDELQYKAVAILSDGTSSDVTLTAVWGSTAASVATVNTAGIAKAIAAGATTISASLSGKTGQGTLNVASRTLGDNTPPTAAITSPADGGSVTGPTAIVGTASDANFLRYELAIALAGDDNYTVVGEGTSPVTNGTLGTLDPAVLVNDQYTLRLRVYDRAENESEATTTVQLSGDRKVGLFTLTFQDLNIALTGVPITVTRTYDSRDKAKGDFGVGWRLGLQTLRLRTNRVLGTGWERVQSGATSSLLARGPHKVSLTLPDGRVEEFDLQLSPTSGIGVITSTRVTGFAPRQGTQGTLEGLDNPDLLLVNAGFEDVLVDDGTLELYDPKRFRYTTLDGTKIEIHRSDGVRKITDRNGIAITFGPSGITHSAGPSVVFTRDAQGRITSVTDLNGNAQTYAYDGNGDLVSHTDPTGGVSRYAYNRHHGLIDIRNALGTRVTRNEYDAGGKLVSMTDADGRQVTFAHNETANEDIVTDRLGRQTKLVYDAQGNVTRQERAVTIEGVLVNAVTTSTYDALGNETSTTDPDGRRLAAAFAGILPTTQTVDPAGLSLTTTMQYNGRSDLTQATDPGGRGYAFSYDANGNLTGASFPDTGALSVVNDARGEPVESVDATGTRTVLTRDVAGRVIREDVLASGGALLRRGDTTWDANGNKTSETLHRTIGGTLTPLTTRYTWDAANRLVAVTDPLGGVRRTEYDANGQVVAETDALGRRTSFVYDVLGRRTRTNHADGTFETVTYDAEGNEVATTDRAGRTSAHEYDEAGRRTRTTLPDGSFERTIYTAAGRVAATIDARGNRTDYTYDAAGRQTATTLPPVPDGPGGVPSRPRLQTAYNALGAPATRTDPNGRVTSYTYEASGRLIRTTHPDGTSTQQAWDAKGRRISVTNEEGQVTTFGYDGLGRLVTVAGLPGDATYAYDEAGNVVRQTDALGRITTVAYDALNRATERRYPGGETERYAYDAVGNLVASTDGLGRVTTFAYDATDRLTRKTLPGGATVTYAYTADGRRSRVTDARGSTDYTYDALGRLATIAHPGGETLAYAYDANGNLASLTAPGAMQSYAYDALNRLVRADAPEGAATAAFDLAGNPVRRSAANGVVTDSTFDARNRASLISHKAPGGSTLASYAITYSPASRRTRITEADGSSDNFTYDAKGRLVSETRTGSAAHAATHVYDAVGNRVQTVRGGVSVAYTYDVNDRLLSDGSGTYAWDANGDLASRTQGGVVTRYAFDPEHRLVSVTGGGVAESYAYDADGRRVLAASPTSVRRLLVDARNNTGLPQVLEERNGNGELAARYTYGAERLAMSSGGATSNYLHDALGSVRGLTDANGLVSDRYVFDAYGLQVAASGASPNPYRYRAERFDGETGLYHLRARYYNPAVARFLSRDPFGGRPQSPLSLHRYLYANGDPIGFVDPTGRESLASLTVAQSISNTIKVAEAASKTNQACNAFTVLGTVGYTVMAAQLAYGFASEWFNGIGAFKSSFSVFAVNPAVFRAGDIKSTDIRFEQGYKVKLAFGMKDGTSQSATFGGPDIFTLSRSGPIKLFGKELKKSITKCGAEVGAVALKGTSSDWMGIPSLTIIPALSIEVELLKIIRNEWKLWDGISVDIRSPTGF